MRTATLVLVVAAAACGQVSVDVLPNQNKSRLDVLQRLRNDRICASAQAKSQSLRLYGLTLSITDSQDEYSANGFMFPEFTQGCGNAAILTGNAQGWLNEVQTDFSTFDAAFKLAYLAYLDKRYSDCDAQVANCVSWLTVAQNDIGSVSNCLDSLSEQAAELSDMLE
jgi:hypothetical protein